MDLLSHVPGVNITGSFTPGANTASPYNVAHNGGVDGTGPQNATKNMAEIYNRLLLDRAALIQKAGLSIDNANWIQMAEAIFKIAGGLDGGVCANTGPATAPTTANPYTMYTSALGEVWGYVGGTWRVIANHYKVTDTAYTTAAGNQTVTIFTYTAHRAGTLAAHFYTSAQGGTGAALLQCAIYKNGATARYMTSTRTSANDGMDVTASAIHTVAANDVITFITTGSNCGLMSAMHSLSYID